MKAQTASLITAAIDLSEHKFSSEHKLEKAGLPARDRQRYLSVIKALKSGAHLEKSELVDAFRVLQVELLPELKTGFRREDADYLNGDKFGGHYVYFAPSYALFSELLDESLLQKLFRHPEWNVLSVGAGGAWLEKLLLRIGALSQPNLLVCDSNAKDLPPELNRLVFDMNKPWPSIGRRFELILFSESLCAIEPAKAMSGSELFFESRHCQDMMSANLHYEGYLNVMCEALRFLAPEGQIRMTTQAGIQQHSAHFERRLRQKGHRSISVDRDTPDGLLVIRQSKK